MLKKTLCNELNFSQKIRMVKLQRNIDRTKGVVMDGRDIGSVVFPDADIKLFLTASPDIRAKRRHNEMINDGEIVNIKVL